MLYAVRVLAAPDNRLRASLRATSAVLTATGDCESLALPTSSSGIPTLSHTYTHRQKGPEGPLLTIAVALRG
jgi:hypothetical protein